MEGKFSSLAVHGLEALWGNKGLFSINQSSAFPCRHLWEEMFSIWPRGHGHPASLAEAVPPNLPKLLR